MVDNTPAEDDPVLDRVFHALADPSRRRIVGLLRETKELRVSDIASAFEMSLNGVSKHLKVLEGAELICRRVQGRTHFLSVNWQALQPAYEFLHFYQHFWTQRLDGLVEYAEQQSKQKKETP